MEVNIKVDPRDRKLVQVQQYGDLLEMVSHIESSEYVAYDVEATGVNPRKDTIIGFSVSGQPGVGYYLPLYTYNKNTDSFDQYYILKDSVSVKSADLVEKVLGLLKGKKLIAHNASYDLQITENNFGIDLLPDLWVDTIMLVHTVSEDGVGKEDATEIEKNFRLKDIAIAIQEELGLDLSSEANIEQQKLKKSIKENGGSVTKAKYEIYKADLDILSEYGAADTDLTFRVCFYFLEKLKAEGLEKFFFEEEVMPLYKEVTVPMEKRGIKLDIPFMKKIDQELIIEQQKRKKIVLESLLADPDAQQWLVYNCMQEFPPTNKGRFAAKLCELRNIDLPKTSKGSVSLSKKNIEALPDSRTKEFLITGTTELLDHKDMQEVMLELWSEKNDGELFNIQSKKQLGEIVFDFKKEQPISKTKKGKDKFDDDMIQLLAEKYNWAYDLRIYNKLLKIKSTYIDRFLEMEEDGTFYPYFKQHGTVSGRYGSNLQQLPKPLEEGDDDPIIVYYKNTVRKFFIARPGYKFIDSDYVSLEPTCFASITEDENLREIFRKNWDFYSTIAIRTEKLEKRKDLYPDGVSADRESPVFLKKIDANKRNKAKGYALGVPYGMSDYALKMTLNVSAQEAKRLHSGYLDGFPGLKKWITDSRVYAAKTGIVRNKLGRIRHLPKYHKLHMLFDDKLMDWSFRRELAEYTVSDLYEIVPDTLVSIYGVSYNPSKYLEQMLGTVLRTRGGRLGSTTVLRWYRDYKNGRNNCLNYQLQSLAAGIVNRAAIKINRELRSRGINGLVVAQIHDQLVIEISDDHAHLLAPVIEEIMVTTTQLPGVDLLAPPEIASNLYEGH